MAKKEKTQEKIIEAARDVFHRKGYDGARMQEIADTASINKGLLHYYFKSKDALFERVLTLALEKTFRKIMVILNADLPLFEKIEGFCAAYIGMISRNAYLPRFVIHELGKNPDRFIERFVGKAGRPSLSGFFEQVLAEASAGKIRDVDPKHLMANMISMCVFPFLARPMIQLMGEMDHAEFKRFAEERKTEVARFLIDAIRL